MTRRHGGGANEDERRFQSEPPLVVNGWTIYVWPDFAERWRMLRALVERLRSSDPDGFVHHPAAKLLKALRVQVLEQIPEDPSSDRYRQGLTLGQGYRHWRRAKFLRRFRLFFRYHSEERIIVYAWLNDESTLRKAGSRTDVYEVFEKLLKHGTPPTDWDELIAACMPWKNSETE